MKSALTTIMILVSSGNLFAKLPSQRVPTRAQYNVIQIIDQVCQLVGGLAECKLQDTPNNQILFTPSGYTKVEATIIGSEVKKGILHNYKKNFCLVNGNGLFTLSGNYKLKSSTSPSDLSNFVYMVKDNNVFKPFQCIDSKPRPWKEYPLPPVPQPAPSAGP